jgi:hypothetical protein
VPSCMAGRVVMDRPKRMLHDAFPLFHLVGLNPHPTLHLFQQPSSTQGKCKFCGHEIPGIWWGFEGGDLRWGG